MVEDAFESVFADWKRRAESLDQRLYPIVHTEVDINAPDWQEQLANQAHPADSSGLRIEITSLFSEIIEAFESLNSGQRLQIIELMARNDSLMYSAVIDTDHHTPEGFRKKMILFVIEDQGKDTRDAMITLDYYRKDAQKQGIDVDSIFREMADIAGTRDKYGWGTTRELLLKS